MNMAIDIVPTRWYISGIELEHGLVISMDTSYFAHQAALSHSTMRGNIFIIPQFGDIYRTKIGEGNKEVKLENGSVSSTLNITIEELIRFKRSNMIQPLAVERDQDCTDKEDKTSDLVSLINDAWLAESLLKIGSVTSDVNWEEVNMKHIRALDNLQRSIIEMAQSGMDEDYEDSALYTYNESPILLTDNLGPYDGIRTNNVVREIESFGSVRCYNSVRLSQMILMHYTLNVLPVAFVSKNPNARTIYEKRCPVMCTNFLDDDEEVLSEIAWTEIKRAAKTAIIWAETIGIKPQVDVQ
jgi:hypothetical protein